MRDSATYAFIKHYVEMVLVMLAGMLVLGGAMLGVAAAFGAGRESLQADAPGLYLLGMGLSMALPMIWWMARRGHSVAANAAMAAAMFGPTVVALLLLAGGVLTDFGALMAVEHSIMFPAMVVAMLPYRREFTHAHRPAVA